MATRPSVSLRLGMEGEAEIKAGFENMAASGSSAAKKISGEFERASEDMEAAFKRRQAAIDKMMAVSATPIQKQIDSSVGTGFSSTQNAAAADWNRLLGEQERTANAVRAAIDPLWAAEKRYADELGRLDGLVRNGTLDQDLYAKAVLAAGREFDAAKARLNGMGGGFERSSVQAMMLRSAVSNASSSLASGLPLMTIASEQGLELAGAIGAGGVKEGATGAFAKMAAVMAGPWGLAIQLGVGLLAAFGPKLFETGKGAEEAEKQLKAFEDRQADMGRYIDANTGKLKEQARQLAIIAKMTLPGQIDAQATTTQGYVNMAFYTARQRLAGSPGKDNLLGRIEFDKAIRDAGSNSAVLARNLEDVAKKFPEFRKAADQVSGYAGQALEAAGEIHNLVGRQNDLNTALAGGTVLTTGIIRRQVELATAHDAVAKARAHLTDVQEKGDAIDAMAAGPNKTKALADYKAELTAATLAVQKAEDAKKAQAKASREAAASAREYATLLEHMNQLNLEPINKKMSAGIEKGWDADVADTFKQVAEVRKGISDAANDHTKLVASDLIASRNAIQLDQLQLATLGMAADKRQILIDQLTTEQKLQAANTEYTADETQAILDGVAAQDKMNAVLKAANDNLEEMRSLGEGIIDSLFNPQNWTSWGGLGKTVLHEIETELLKLAAINPLKNLLSGSSLPTLSSALGSLGKLFGGKAGVSFDLPGLNTTPGALTAPDIGHLAGGTEYWSGGATWVGENGRELLNLPPGSKVTPAGRSRQIAEAANDRAAPVFNFDLRGAVVTEELLDQMNAIGASAAVQGAQGGAALANKGLNRRIRKRMR